MKWFEKEEVVFCLEDQLWNQEMNNELENAPGKYGPPVGGMIDSVVLKDLSQGNPWIGSYNIYWKYGLIHYDRAQQWVKKDNRNKLNIYFSKQCCWYSGIE